MLLRARVDVLLAAVLFGTTGTAQALLRPDGASTVAVGAARIAIGGALLVAIASASRGGRIPRASLPVALVGGVGVAIYQVSFFGAVDRAGVAIGTIVAIGSGPAIAGLLGRVLNGDPLTRRWAIATGLACVGVVLLGLGGGDGAGAGPDPIGIALAVVAGAGYALYTVLAKRLIQRGVRPTDAVAATFGTGGLLLVPVLLVAGGGWLADPAGLGLAVYLGAIPTALAYVVFARGLRHLSAGETATLTLAEPLTATLLGALVLGERPGAMAIAGAAAVLAGLVVVGAPRQRSAAFALATLQGDDGLGAGSPSSGPVTTLASTR